MPQPPPPPSFARRNLERGIRAFFPGLMRSSVQKGLRGVWLRGQMPRGGALLAGNHHSWWDGYLAFTLAQSAGLPMSGLMDQHTLERLPFFRLLGAISSHEPRAAIRSLRSGQLMFIFPEGKVCPQGRLQTLHSGVFWMARQAGVPILPLAIRCVLRGHQLPEAYLWVGPPTEHLERDLGAMLEKLDFDLLHHDPERELPGFEPLLHGHASTQESAEFASRMLRLALERL